MNKTFKILAAAAAVLAFASSAANAKTILRFGTDVSVQNTQGQGAKHFAELVKERSKGNIEIKVYFDSTLGNTMSLISGARGGTLDIAMVGSSNVSGLAPQLAVLDIPFIFKDKAHAYRALDGEVGQKLMATLEDKNLKGLAFFENGFRNITNSVKPVANAADVAGLKLRVMENEIYTATFKALGVNAVPMNWQDTLTALQQGTVEGQENPINVIWSYKMWEYNQKYCVLDRHSYSTAIITMSLDLFNSLDEATQEIFLTSAQEAAEYERAWVAEKEAGQLQEIKDNGIEVIENPDVNSFREAVQVVYDAYPQYADYIARIQAELA